MQSGNGGVNTIPSKAMNGQLFPPCPPPVMNGAPPPMIDWLAQPDDDTEGPVAKPPNTAGESMPEFGARIMETVNAGFIALSIAVGKETGLFSVLAGFEGQPKTSQEIADEAGLKERYVREWLGAMTTGRIVNMDASGKRFFLPPHRAIFLTTPGLGYELTILAAALPMQGKVFNYIIDSFKRDGPRGISYEHFGDFHRFMNACSLIWWDRHLVSTFIPSIPGLKDMLETGISVLDLGCGEGGASLILGKAFPQSSIVGVDLCSHAVAEAKKAATAQQLTGNVHFVEMDAHDIPDDWEGRFHYVLAWDSIHDMARPEKILERVRKVLAPGGRMSVLEVNARSAIADNMNMPFASTFYTNSMFHCMTVQLHAGGEGLGNMWGRERAEETLRSGGFKVETFPSPFEGSFNCHFLCKLENE
ncbi:uncharacterized protein LOC110987100 [Acanthaster planci]|uniref:Uncharacterized protein LOC110987100 n=1 Tax=Acanthaster planci TaxID=133434 RepID=A0A8B7ZK21_ACAPL|nr:uncharacterized protein LOC110987100 [Acanthaster planci]